MNTKSIRDKSSQRRRLRPLLGALIAILAAGALTNWVLFPLPKEKLIRPHGAYVYSREGLLLNCFTAEDRFWRKPAKLSEISPLLIKSVLACEDRWFYYHPGFNPISLVSATVDNVRTGKFVRGGSTITMQIARMIEPKPRTIPNKALEILRAVQLELAYSKSDLLEIYFNIAPYGGNIEGVGSAAHLYFGKDPLHLSPSEVAILTTIPASPTRFRPDADPAACVRRRNVVLNRLCASGLISRSDRDEAMKEDAPVRRTDSPVAAPHFCQSITSAHSSEAVIRTTLDYALQQTCENLSLGYQSILRDKGISNLALVVIDNQSGELRAMVGSADFGDLLHQGQINGALAPRSPGSALKPFVYALGFEKGLISPARRIEDLPTNYAGYIPVNYDGEYHGVVSVSDALIQSLNVPAVNLCARLGLGNVYDLFKRGGITTLCRKQSEYGLPLVLGACEVNLIELSNLYATLARGGLYRPVRMLQADTSGPSFRLLSEASTYLVSEILAELKRPDLPSSWEATAGMPRVAWKTGTSYGRKDAWAIGYTPQFTVGVWAGNFTAEGSIAIVGAEIAAPLMLDIFNHLATLQGQNWFETPPSIDVRSVCAISGMPAGDACDQTLSEQYIIGVTPEQTCTVHRKIHVDPKTRNQVCVFCQGNAPAEDRVIEIWPPKIATWLLRHGIIDFEPPHNPACRGEAGGEGPIITSPEPGAVYFVQNKAHPEFQKILFEASAAADCREVHWFLDGQLVASAAPESRVLYAPPTGNHRLLCIDGNGRSSAVSFTVQ